MTRPTITPELLRELIDYDPETGALTWKRRGVHLFAGSYRLGAARAAKIWNSRYAGKPALAALPPSGYLEGTVFGRSITAHRAAYIIAHGIMPEGPVAHLDGNRTNNRIANLRAGTQARTAGSSGIYLHANRWQARVSINGRRHYLGRFAKREDATAAIRALHQQHGYTQEWQA